MKSADRRPRVVIEAYNGAVVSGISVGGYSIKSFVLGFILGFGIHWFIGWF